MYRLITRNSYEREMFDRASLKLGLDKAVLQSMSGRDNSLGGGGVRINLLALHQSFYHGQASDPMAHGPEVDSFSYNVRDLHFY